MKTSSLSLNKRQQNPLHEPSHPKLPNEGVKREPEQHQKTSPKKGNTDRKNNNNLARSLKAYKNTREPKGKVKKE